MVRLPVYYKGNPGQLGAHGDVVAMPSYAENWTSSSSSQPSSAEAGRTSPADEALDHVYGYMIYNDFSARDIPGARDVGRARASQGQGFRRRPRLRPVASHGRRDPGRLRPLHEREVNGEPWCGSDTSTMHWRFEDMIAHASRETGAYGEIFGSGTVGGGSAAEVGHLQAGDQVELSMDLLGTLCNRIRKAGQP